jgi:hypothetical protein
MNSGWFFLPHLNEWDRVPGLKSSGIDSTGQSTELGYQKWLLRVAKKTSCSQTLGSRGISTGSRVGYFRSNEMGFGRRGRVGTKKTRMPPASPLPPEINQRANPFHKTFVTSLRRLRDSRFEIRERHRVLLHGLTRRFVASFLLRVSRTPAINIRGASTSTVRWLIILRWAN